MRPQGHTARGWEHFSWTQYPWCKLLETACLSDKRHHITKEHRRSWWTTNKAAKCVQ